MLIQNNIQKILKNIEEACRTCHRDASEVSLIAVSKLHPVKKIIQAIRSGQKKFGENYVQEFNGKYDQIPNIQWHFIGSLQSKKIKDLVGKTELIHSVDRVKIIQEINKRASEKCLIQKILVQLNLAKEDSKSGVYEKDLSEFMNTLNSFPNVRCVGFMIMPPLYADVEQVRPLYKQAKFLLRKYKLQELSMGTSYDYKVAIEEGATMIRVGTDIFGSR